jgi:hypothetical protein
VVGSVELEARADGVLQERSGEAGGERGGGLPACAVSGYDVVGGEFGERVAGRFDERLELMTTSVLERPRDPPYAFRSGRAIADTESSPEGCSSTPRCHCERGLDE